MADPTPLRHVLADCRRLLSVRGEANGPLLAKEIMQRIDALTDEQRARFFDRLASDFSPDPQAVLGAAQAYADARDATSLIRLTRVAEPPRQELFRRLNGAPGGTAAIVRLRRGLLDRLPKQPQLRVVEADLLHLLSSWFNPGFLRDAQGGLEFAGAAAGADHPPRSGAPDRRLGRPAPPPATRPPLLRLLPPAIARRAADLRRGGAAARDGRRDRAADRQALARRCRPSSSRWPCSIRSAIASRGCAACRWATS